MSKCYLLGQLDGDRIVGVMVCGETPWTMTKYDRTEYIIVAEGTGETFQSAKDSLREMYPAYMPKLAARFPFPE